jgi:hypothetical protein
VFATLLLVCLADPEWPERRLDVGQQLMYSGQIKHCSERPGNKYRHTYTLDVLIVVLAIRDAKAECAIMTTVTANPEQSISAATVQISGQPVKKTVAPAIRVELIRLPMNRTIERAAITQAPPWTAIDYQPDAVPPLDGPDYGETGIFAGKANEKEPVREWVCPGPSLWNGSRVMDFQGTQHSEHFADITKAVSGWRRTDIMQMSPIDGLPRTMTRTIEQREGKHVVSLCETTLVMKPPQPALDVKTLRLARQDAEMAAWFGLDSERVVRDQKAKASFQETVSRWISQHSGNTIFRPALECLAAKNP